MKLPLRRRRFKTAFLAALVHPIPLLESLKELQKLGNIEWFQYGKYNTIIKLTKHSELDSLIKEASQPVATTRLNKKHATTIRKTKSKMG